MFQFSRSIFIALFIFQNFGLKLIALDVQKIIQSLYKEQWDEVILDRETRKIWGGSTHDRILKIVIFEEKDDLSNAIREYCTQRYLSQLLKEYDQEHSIRERATILEPQDLRISKECTACFFTMERLYPLRKEQFLALRRLYLGCSNHRHEIKFPKAFARNTPNHYYSYEEIEKMISPNEKSNIQQVCFDLGTLLALIHLKGKKDGNNMEVSLVKRSKNSHLHKLLLLDFDRLRDLGLLFASGDQEIIIQTLLHRMKKENYFPYPTTSGFKYFREGYLQVARHLDEQQATQFYLPLAEKLMLYFVKDWIRNKFVDYYSIEYPNNSYVNKLHIFKKMLKKKVRLWIFYPL